MQTLHNLAAIIFSQIICFSLNKPNRSKSCQHPSHEPPHDKTNKMACAPSEDSDQPGHPPSLISVFAVRLMGSKDPSFLHADSEDSDQTGRSLRWAHTHLVGFVMSRLI